MKILLKSENPAVLSIVEICCERAGFDRPYTKDDGEFDLVIKDCERLEDVTDDKETLFLIPRNFKDEVGNAKFIIKPFLPTELIKFLKDYETKADFSEEKFSSNTKENLDEKISPLVSEENLSKQIISLKDEDKKDELEKIGSLINEIDEMDNSKTNDKTLKEEDSLDEYELDDLLENLDDDVPLDELIGKLDAGFDDELTCNEEKKEELNDADIKPISIDTELLDENLDDTKENHDKDQKSKQDKVEKIETSEDLKTIPLFMYDQENLEDEISKKDEESKKIEEVTKNEESKTTDELSFFDEYDEVKPHNPPLTALDIEELDDRCDDKNSQNFEDDELNDYDLDDEFKIKSNECENKDEKSCEVKDDACKKQDFISLNDLLSKKENETSNEDLKKIAKKEMEKELKEALKNGKFKEIFKDMQIKIKISFKED